MPNPEFGANVRTISQEVGYTRRGKDSIIIPTIEEIQKAFDWQSFSKAHLSLDNKLIRFGEVLAPYFEFRAALLK